MADVPLTERETTADLDIQSSFKVARVVNFKLFLRANFFIIW